MYFLLKLGNLESDLQAGAYSGYQLLWVNIFTVIYKFLQNNILSFALLNNF